MTDHGQPQGLPATWTRVQLGEVGVVHCGQSPPTAAVNKEGRGTPYVTGPEQWDGSRLHMDKWTTEPKRMAPAGSVFVTVKGAGVGTVFPGVAAAIGRDVYAFEPKAGVSPSFVEHALRFTVQDVIRHAIGDIPGLSKSHITDHWIGLPPPEEQQLIVAAIESHFSRLDAATATLERVQRNLERYRASVLKAAVEGRLVPTEAELAKKEGRTYEPASTLLKRILTERRRRWEEAELAKLTAKGKKPTDHKWKAKYEEPAAPDVCGLPELPEGWCWSTVDAIGDVLLGRQRAPQYLTGRYPKPYLRVANIKDDHIDFSDVEQMDFDEQHFEKYRLQAGDILVSEGQSPELLGQSAIFRGRSDPLCFQKTLHRFRPLRGGPSSEFAQLVFRSHVRNGVFMRLGSITTNIAHLTLEKFKASPFPLAPQREQPRVEVASARQLSLIDSLDVEVSTQLTRIARLRQSILKWAFEGRLVGRDAS